MPSHDLTKNDQQDDKTAPVCTVNEGFMGIPLGDCGEPATRHITASCENGHDETTPMCDKHAEIFESGEFPLLCTACLESGAGLVPVSVPGGES